MQYGCIGEHLVHSFSKEIHNKIGTYDYILREVARDDLDRFMTKRDFAAINVTIPYKEKVLSYLDYISVEARAIGAVNVIRVEHKGNNVLLKGYNSDVIGFTKSIEPILEKFHRKALVLGTGGASKAVSYGLRSLGLETVLVSRFERPGTIQYKDITPDVVREYKVIVNCTPCGMYPNYEECPELPYEALDSHNLLYDLIYNPDETLFMKNGREQGALTKNGIEMLLLQAFASWDFWNGKEHI